MPKTPTSEEPTLSATEVMHDLSELEPATIAGEEVEADPEDVEGLLLGDSELLQRSLQAILLLEEDPLTPERVAHTLEIPVEVARRGLEGARDRLRDEGIIVAVGAGSYRLATHPETASIVERYMKKARRRRMSRAMLETLAIIACQGPVTRAQIEETRGVNSDGVVGRCLDLDLIEVTGQKETPGRPLLYGITDTFLRYFGLESAADLEKMLPAEWANLPRQGYLDLPMDEDAPTDAVEELVDEA